MIFREYCELVVFVQLYTVQAMLPLQNTFPGLGSKPVTNAPVFLEGGPVRPSEAVREAADWLMKNAPNLKQDSEDRLPVTCLL